MNADPNAAIARYPLRSLLPALRTFRPPEGDFDPAGPWQQAWGVCTLAGRQPSARRVGRLALDRRLAGETSILEVGYFKDLTGGRQEVTATLEGPAGSPLATPERWSFRIRLLDTKGEAVPHTEIARRAAFAGGRITVEDAVERRTLDPGGPYTVNWCLFDAVQRLPGPETRPLAFTLIDHFDQAKPETTLAFRGEMDVQVAGGRTLRTRAYEQLGRGNVPWVYWTDEAGRLVWVVAGLEGYVLEAAAPIQEAARRKRGG
jgi:hypothetical protein